MKYFFLCLSPDLKSPSTQRMLSIVLLVLRLQMGIAFIFHGWPKIQNAFAWMPPGAPIPGIFQALAAFSEFAGGIALIFGIFTRLNAIGLIITMTVAALFHISSGDPFVGFGASWEAASVYWVISFAFLVLGAGDFSIDQLFRNKTSR